MPIDKEFDISCSITDRKSNIDQYAYTACNVRMTKLQYTIRNIPPVVDRVIRKRSKQTGKSFNHTVVDLLSLQTLGTTSPKQEDNFDWLYGAMTFDEGFDEAIKDQSRIDEELWK